MSILILNTFNDNNEYNLDLTAFTGVIYTKAEEDFFQPNVITFNQVPTLTEIKSCLQTNVNRIQELAQKAIQNDDEDAYYDYLPDYIKELLYFIEGLHENKLLNREQVIPYITQLQNMDLDGFSLDMLEEFIGSN